MQSLLLPSFHDGIGKGEGIVFGHAAANMPHILDGCRATAVRKDIIGKLVRFACQSEHIMSAGFGHGGADSGIGTHAVVFQLARDPGGQLLRGGAFKMDRCQDRSQASQKR